MVSLFKKVEKFVKEKKLAERNDRVLLAVSGGPDSIFLFHFFIYFSKKENIEIKVSYIHHHLRPEAYEEVKFVENLSKKFNIEFFREDVEIKEKRNIEKFLREKRYEKLYQLSLKAKCNKIATGHTLDDNVETLIMNLLRGTGLSGLCGIWPQSKIFPETEITVIRPLLCVEKKEIIDYLKKNKIEYLIDTSNLSLSFFRNRVRNKIIPFLIKYKPSLKRQISKMIFLIQDEEDFLRKYTEKIYEEVASQKESKIYIYFRKFNLLDIVLKRRIAGYIYRKIKKTPYINYSKVEKIVREIEKGMNIFDEETLDDILKNRRKNAETFIYKINFPGETKILNSIIINTEIIEFSEKIFNNVDKLTGYFDLSKIKGEIIVRNRKKGDKFIPLGLKKMKRLSRFMIDKKIPEYQRDRILIFENNNKIMWVCGYEISEEFKVEKNTQKIMKISVKQSQL